LEIDKNSLLKGEFKFKVHHINKWGTFVQRLHWQCTFCTNVPHDRKFNPPLGWSLSEVTMKTIEGYLGAKGNGDKLTKLVQELASSPVR